MRDIASSHLIRMEFQNIGDGQLVDVVFINAWALCRCQCVSVNCVTDCSLQAQACEGVHKHVNTLALRRSRVRLVPMSSDVQSVQAWSTTTVL